MITNNPPKEYSLYLKQIEIISDKIKNKSILITGGTGLFGNWIVDFFLYFNSTLNLNSKITLLTRQNPKKILENFSLDYHKYLFFIQGDIRSFEPPKQEFDFLIHGGGLPRSPIYDSNPFEMNDVIINGTVHLLNFVKQLKIKKILFVSSGAVYGDLPLEHENFSEDMITAPKTNDIRSLYGEAKRMAELLCVIAGQKNDLEVKIARCFTFTGPNIPLDQQFAIGNFIRDVLNGRDIIIAGDSRTVRSYMYSTDLSLWLWTILLQGKNNEIYNVGSDEPISILELAETVKKVSSFGGNIIQNGDPDGFNRVSKYYPSVQKAKRELSLSIQYNALQSVEKTFLWCKTHS